MSSSASSLNASPSSGPTAARARERLALLPAQADHERRRRGAEHRLDQLLGRRRPGGQACAEPVSGRRRHELAVLLEVRHERPRLDDRPTVLEDAVEHGAQLRLAPTARAISANASSRVTASVSSAFDISRSVARTSSSASARRRSTCRAQALGVIPDEHRDQEEHAAARRVAEQSGLDAVELAPGPHEQKRERQRDEPARIPNTIASSAIGTL